MTFCHQDVVILRHPHHSKLYRLLGGKMVPMETWHTFSFKSHGNKGSMALSAASSNGLWFILFVQLRLVQGKAGLPGLGYLQASSHCSLFSGRNRMGRKIKGSWDNRCPILNSFLKIYFLLFMSVYTCESECPQMTEVCWSCWSWNCRCLWASSCGCWNLNMGPLAEQ